MLCNVNFNKPRSSGFYYNAVKRSKSELNVYFRAGRHSTISSVHTFLSCLKRELTLICTRPRRRMRFQSSPEKERRVNYTFIRSEGGITENFKIAMWRRLTKRYSTSNANRPWTKNPSSHVVSCSSLSALIQQTCSNLSDLIQIKCNEGSRFISGLKSLHGTKRTSRGHKCRVVA